MIYQLRRMPKPVLVAAQGGVAGIGMSLLMAADLAIVSDDAFFTLAYRHIGLSADGCATYLLPRIVGERRALEIALLGNRFPAAEAKALGLVNWVVPRAELHAEALRIATDLANGPTLALGLAKRLIRNAWDASWDEQSHREAEAMAVAATTADHREGVAAFVEKRAPKFTGRSCPDSEVPMHIGLGRRGCDGRSARWRRGCRRRSWSSGTAWDRRCGRRCRR